MRSVLFSAICLFLGSVTITATETAADGTIVPADWQDLHDRWQTIMQELRIPGMAVVVVKGDEVVLLDALGVCDPAGKQRVTPRSPFYLASVTKSFTALGVAILVEEGKVKLDAPVKTYLPRFTLADDDATAKVTVRDLLAHRLGIDSGPIGLAEAYLGNINEDRFYRLLTLVEPENAFRYTNLHYTLAGRIITAVTGQKWQDFLAERVFVPLQMVDSTCYASKLYANPLVAWPIVERAGEWQVAPLVKGDSVMHAAGGMGASAHDLGNWLRFHITGKTPDGKQLISQKLLDEIHKRQVVDKDASSDVPGYKRDGYSLGWFTGSFHDHPLREHGGGYIGTSTIVSFLPEEQMGVAVLVNESSPNPVFTQLVSMDVYGKLLELTIEDPLPRMRNLAKRLRARQAGVVELDWAPPSTGNGLDQPLTAYVGDYENSFWGEASIAMEEGALTFRVGELPLRWHALDGQRFRLEIPPSDVIEGEFLVSPTDSVTGFTVVTPQGKAEFRRQD
jgi:CubicO group peptidase (beta-lactamase class C family)